MAFQPGESGNPNGRPKGSLNKRTELMKLLDVNAEDLVSTLIELALNGDMKAMQLCIDRLIPKAQPYPFSTPFPELDTQNQNDSLANTTEIINSTLKGDITPDNAKILINIIEEHKRKIEEERFSIKL